MTYAWSDTAARLTSWFQRKTWPNAVRRIAAFPAALSSDVGLKREENQDRVAIARGACAGARPYVLAVLSDGIGGMKDGAGCAAATMGNVFACFLDISRTGQAPEPTLKLAVNAANSAIYNKLAGKGGATLSAVLLCQGVAYAVNVGDSRIYKYSGGQLTQLTVDDTIAGQLGHKVDIDVGADLLQFIGIGDALEVNVTQVAFDQDDMLLLTSDGVHYLDQGLIATLIANSPDPGTALRRLTETTKWCGGHDNASAAIVLPHMTLQELSTASDDSYGIWDPFGELHLLSSRSQPGQLASPVQPLEPVRHEIVTAGHSPENGLPPEPAAQTKGKRKRKAKSSAQGDIEDVLKGNQDKQKPPQLKIEFPRKAN